MFVVHSFPTCGECNKLKEILEANGTEFENRTLSVEVKDRTRLLSKMRTLFPLTDYTRTIITPIIELDNTAMPCFTILNEETGRVRDDIIEAIKKVQERDIKIVKRKLTKTDIQHRKKIDPDNVILDLTVDETQILNLRMLELAKVPTHIQTIVDNMTPEEKLAFATGVKVAQRAYAIMVAKQFKWSKEARNVCLRIDPYMDKTLRDMFEEDTPLSL